MYTDTIVQGTIASTLKARTPEFQRAKQLKESLAEKKEKIPFILGTIKIEITVHGPSPAVKQETKTPQVSYNEDEHIPCTSKSLVYVIKTSLKALFEVSFVL